MKVVTTHNNKPILCLFATREINAGEEILYDYGEKNYPWENKVRQ
jgi:SET domain-containing protein